MHGVPSMRIAVAYWNNRIAPVFDVARNIDVLEVVDGAVAAESHELLPDPQPVQKAATLARMGVNVLICGAISAPVQEMVKAYGITVYPFVAGDLEQVKRAWLANGLRGGAYAMPGCGRHRRCGARSGGEHRRGAKNRGGG